MQLTKLWRDFRSRDQAGREWLAPFLALIALIFLSDMAAGPSRTLLPVYGEAVLHRPPYFVSALVSLQQVFGAIAAFAGGALGDALGQKRLLLLGLSGVPLVGLGFMIGSPVVLVLLWVYIGFAFGALTVGRQSYMMATVPSKYLGTATALVFFGLTLGSALGNSLAARVLNSYGFRTLGAGMAVVAVVALLIGLAAMPSSGGVRGKGVGGAFAGYRGILRRRPVQYLALLRFVPTSYWGTATLLTPLLIYRASGTASAAAYYGAASLLFASGCQLISGRVVDRFGVRRPIVVLTSLIAGMSLVTSLFAQSLVGLYVCGILGAGIAWSLSVTIPGVVNGIVPRAEHGRTLGFTHVAWSAGMLTGTQIGGLLVDVNSGLPFLVMGLFNLVAVGSALALGKWLKTPPEGD